MKKISFLTLCLIFVGSFFLSTLVYGDDSAAEFNIASKPFNQVTQGIDSYGFDYLNHRFIGEFCSLSRGANYYCDFNDPMLNGATKVIWNDAYLSNKDRNGDGKLDRHYGYESYLSSEACMLLRYSTVFELDGEMIHYESGSKHVAAKKSDVAKYGGWFSKDGTYLGPQVIDEFILLDTWDLEWRERIR
ncbi:MAG: hypothetical protein KAJ58_00590 [Candidatus Pacebacteria bacterium]|nr:hypothetical protein [Candidatus Paceibacterota bacterium]